MHHTLNPLLIKLAQNLLISKDVGALPWIQLYDIDMPWRGPVLSLTTEDEAQPLYYAASIGLSQVIERMMPHITNVNAEGGEYASAL